jgi:hypothetical protein
MRNRVSPASGVGGELEFWISENPRKFRRGGARNQGHAVPFAPMPTKPGQAAIRKYECRHNDRCVKDHKLTHGCLRAHDTAAVTSSSSIPNWASRARTSSARLFCSGRRMMHSPSVLTSKYSTPVKRATTFLGRVIWFLVVFLASTIPRFRETRKSYRGHLLRGCRDKGDDEFRA